MKEIDRPCFLHSGIRQSDSFPRHNRASAIFLEIFELAVKADLPSDRYVLALLIVVPAPAVATPSPRHPEHQEIRAAAFQFSGIRMRHCSRPNSTSGRRSRSGRTTYLRGRQLPLW